MEGSPRRKHYKRSAMAGLKRSALCVRTSTVKGPPGGWEISHSMVLALGEISSLGNLNRRVLWCHFRPFGASTYVVISAHDEENIGFTSAKPRYLDKFGSFGNCVMVCAKAIVKKPMNCATT